MFNKNIKTAAIWTIAGAACILSCEFVPYHAQSFISIFGLVLFLNGFFAYIEYKKHKDEQDDESDCDW